MAVAEDHADSDWDTSGDCRDIDLEQAGRSKSDDDCLTLTPALTTEQPPTLVCVDPQSQRYETSHDQMFSHEEAGETDLVSVNRNEPEIPTERMSNGEAGGAVISAMSDQMSSDYDVPRSTPVRERLDEEERKCHRERRPKPAPPPPPNDEDDTLTASSTPLDGTPSSQASSSTLKCGSQTAGEPVSASTSGDNLIRVELSGETLTVIEPTHMSWEEVLQSAQVLGIPLNPPRQPPPPAVMTCSDSAAVRRSSTSSSVTSSDRSFVSSPMNSPGARCRTSAPPVVLPRHLVNRRAVSSSPSTKQPKPKKISKGASPFREKLHNLFARKVDEGQSKDRGRDNASPTDGRHRSCSGRTRHRDRRDDVDCSHRDGGHSARVSVDMSASELINCESLPCRHNLPVRRN